MWVMILAPMLNFLTGINIDLYAPSLPSIADYFQVSIVVAKNTITATMLGFALGCLVFGALIDIVGRRKIIFFGLFAFIVVSFLALLSSNITELMIIRFIQGMMVSTVSIGSRALVVDHFAGKRFVIAILYTSVAYGAGPVLAPFIGGLLQYYFGWKANFLAYAFFGILLIILFLSVIKESLKVPQPSSLKHVLKQYWKVVTHKAFIMGALILGGVLVEQITYPTVGPFLVEQVMHRSPIAYGNSALFAGCSYLLGTLVNRFLVHKLSQRELVYLGFSLLVLGVLIQWIFALSLSLNFFSLIFPIMVIGFSFGFIFPNVLGACLKFFPNNVGVASAVQACSLMIIGAVGIFIISYFNITHLINLTPIYASIAVLQIIIFFFFFRKEIEHR